MRANVDQELCTGCGLCAELCPEVFELTGDKAEVRGDVVPPDAETTCREAMADCPVEAISLDD